MKPRVLILNFANGMDMNRVGQYTKAMIKNLAISSRYHGYSNPDAPEFLEYQVIKYVDMRDDSVTLLNIGRNSTLTPNLKDDARKKGDNINCDYNIFYTTNFAARYGFRDPSGNCPFLDLHGLINSGMIHELWFFRVHDDSGAPFESVEFKQYYDDECHPIPGKHGPAGNGHSKTMPWSGRSFRITFFNPDRGLGCGMENFCHALEGMANYNSIPYFRKYFHNFAEFDMDVRYKLPGRSLYGMITLDRKKGDMVEYPSQTTMRIYSKGNIYDLTDYVAVGGNVHFPPAARWHYDMDSPFAVISTMENYRLGNLADGKDKVEIFSKDKFKQYSKVCPDGMGPWLMYWRQNFPGLDNKCKADQGKAMKNWWPFLFY